MRFKENVIKPLSIYKVVLNNSQNQGRNIPILFICIENNCLSLIRSATSCPCTDNLFALLEHFLDHPSTRCSFSTLYVESGTRGGRPYPLFVMDLHITQYSNNFATKKVPGLRFCNEKVEKIGVGEFKDEYSHTSTGGQS
jgi:hypothetical protein